MLNLTIAMLPPHKPRVFQFFLPLVLAPLLFFSAGRSPVMQPPAATQTQAPQAVIDSPGPGEALQGVVTISGTTGLADFRSAEVAFAYQADPTGTWFTIQQSSQPVNDGALARWDTTTITDGEYRLRLQVFLKDGRVLESLVEGVRVRNYTPVETSTPIVPTPGQPTPTFTATPRKDFVAVAQNPTLLPTNPAQVTGRDLQLSALQGVMLVLSALVAAGVYLGVRALSRRR